MRWIFAGRCKAYTRIERTVPAVRVGTLEWNFIVWYGGCFKEWTVKFKLTQIFGIQENITCFLCVQCCCVPDITVYMFCWHFRVIASIDFNIATSSLISYTTNPGHCLSFLFNKFKERPRPQLSLIHRHHGNRSDGSGKNTLNPRQRTKVRRSGHRSLQRVSNIPQWTSFLNQND